MSRFTGCSVSGDERRHNSGDNDDLLDVESALKEELFASVDFVGAAMGDDADAQVAAYLSGADMREVAAQSLESFYCYEYRRLSRGNKAERETYAAIRKAWL